MDPDEVEALRIGLVKDARTARYAARVSWWQAVTGAGLGAILVAAGGQIAGQLTARSVSGLLFLGVVLLALGIRSWLQEEDQFVQDTLDMAAALERLKGEGAP